MNCAHEGLESRLASLLLIYNTITIRNKYHIAETFCEVECLRFSLIHCMGGHLCY